MRRTLSILAAAAVTAALGLLCEPAAAMTYQGTAAANTFVGTTGADRAAMGAGSDTARGGAGSDSLHGGTGPDVLYAGDGSDSVNAGPGRDQVRTGPGNDEVILRNDGRVDEIWCGAGTDTVVWLNSEPDPLDVFHDCEETLSVFVSA